MFNNRQKYLTITIHYVTFRAINSTNKIINLNNNLYLSSFNQQVTGMKLSCYYNDKGNCGDKDVWQQGKESLL
jgi:hypothetical protein